MNRLHLLSIVCITSFLCFCSSGERIAGSKGGSETTNGITACILKSDGRPAAGSIVLLRKADFVSRTATLTKSTLNSADIITDSSGRFTIVDIDSGEYCIEVNDTSTGEGNGGAVLLNCSMDSTNIQDLGIDYLKPYAVVAGQIDTEVLNGENLFVQVRGLERLAMVNETGSFSFADLPEGDFEIVIVEGNNMSGKEKTTCNVKASAGKTAIVNIGCTFTDSGYIVINPVAAGVSSDAVIVDFPLLMRFNELNFDFTQTLPNGEDVRFSKIDGTSIPFEIEQWDTLTKMAAVWLRIDTIFGNKTEQRFVMKWGDTSAHSKSSGEDVFRSESGFKGVWHLDENPESGSNSIKDRTGNGFNGTPSGSMSDGNSVNGMIGKAIMLDGKDDHITAGRLNISDNYSLSCWVRATDLTEAARRFIWKEYSYTLWYDAQGKGIRIEHFTLQDSVAVWRGIYQDGSQLIPLDTAAWYYLAGTYDGDKIRLYINGELADSTKAIGKYPVSSTETLSIGGRREEYVRGIMDEVRIESHARSEDWIKLSYLTQKENVSIVQVLK